MRRVGRHRVLRDLDGVLARARAAMPASTFLVEQLETLSAVEQVRGQEHSTHPYSLRPTSRYWTIRGASRGVSALVRSRYGSSAAPR